MRKKLLKIKELIKKITPNFILDIYFLSKSIVANIIYGFPYRWLIFIWVTWTDGKTTTNELIYHILKSAWKKVWIMSTHSYDLWVWQYTNDTKMTTNSHIIIQKNLKEMRKNWVKYVVLEPSSHWIYQFRFWPIKFKCVSITNLTNEHLDFHKTMYKYFRTKAKLFKYVSKDSIWIIPKTFKYNKELKNISKTSKIWEFDKTQKCDLFAEDIKQKPELKLKLNIFWEKINLETKMIWDFNIDNILIALWITRFLWLTKKEIKKAVENFSTVPGRQEIIKSDKWIDFIIDFALTPNSSECLYKAIKQLWYKRQIALFWSCGWRYKDKRPIMWEIAEKNNDLVILTEDENYEENWMDIIKDIASWFKDKKNYKIIQDRKMAIEYAFKKWKKWDVIVLAWMGSFNSRQMWDNNIPWNEKEVVKKLIK